MGICIFVLFMRRGVLMKKKNPVVRFLSSIEYGIYLCHHSVMYVLQAFYLRFFTELDEIPYYILCLVATILFATLITYVTRWILKKFAERKVLTAS